MSKPHVKYLLVGGGLASGAAAEAIRGLDRQGELMLVGQEASAPYNRPPLSKGYLRKTEARDSVFVKPARWYADNSVQLRTGRRVAALDTARRSATLDSGEEISFDQMLIAIGATPRQLNIPGIDLPNLFYYRTLEDADRLHHAIEQAQKVERTAAHATVIGAGVLGVELAASLVRMGLTVDLLGDVWRKFAGETTTRFVARALEAAGVKLHPGARPARLEGDGRVQRVILASGAGIECDFAIAAVGAVANKEILRGTPITSEKAILVDDHCRTNVPGIYAAGDCCAVFDRLFGKHRMLDHWDNAIATGTIAGVTMAGGDRAYDVVNYFFSDVLDWSLSAWGEARFVDRTVLRGAPNVDKPDFVEFGIAADGRIAQVLAVNHAGEDDLLKSLVARRVQVAGNEEILKDPASDLQALV